MELIRRGLDPNAQAPGFSLLSEPEAVVIVASDPTKPSRLRDEKWCIIQHPASVITRCGVDDLANSKISARSA